MSIFSDISRLEHIIYHCERLEVIRQRFGDSVEQLINDLEYKDALITNIVQIGENVNGLSSDFRREHDIIPWGEIKNFRNIVVHRYDTINIKLLYSAITDDMPKLKQYCDEQLKKILTQQSS